MLKRKAYETLLEWKERGAGKALLIDGARQIGKTFLVEEFAQREFAEWVKVDFLRDADANSLSSAQGVKDLVERLSLLVEKPIVPGNTLVFFDEVQEAQNLVTLAKYLAIDGRFRLVMSGSLLGVELRDVRSFPVGYLQTVHMFPLDFEEFLWSQGAADTLISRLREHFEAGDPVEEGLHNQLVATFRRYLTVGGMPEAVQAYLDSDGDLARVRQVQAALNEQYREDISKHAGRRKLQVRAIFDAIPSQLDKENKRFELKAIRSKAVFERYANDFAWLVSAGVALQTLNVTEPKHPLKCTEKPNRFKLYQSDTGMLMAQYPVRTALAVLSGTENINRGSLYENVVAQVLRAAGVPLRYFHRNRVGEVDFLAESAAGPIVPIEVKSGKGYKRHVALNNLLGNDEFDVPEAFVVSEANVQTVRKDGKAIRYIPLYMVPLLCETLASTARDAHEEIRSLGLAADALRVPPLDLSGL